MSFVTTSTNTTTYNVVVYHRVAPPRAENYRSYWWFHDRLRLLDNARFHFHRCKHDPLPDKPPHKDPMAWEEVDPYFLEEMKLEKKGWQSFSLAEYSPNEFKRLRKWADKHNAYLKLDHHADSDIFSLLGAVDTRCTVICVPPALIEECEAFLTKMTHERPCSVITTKPLSREVKRLLPSNTLVLKGTDATLVSFARTKNYQKICNLLR